MSTVTPFSVRGTETETTGPWPLESLSLGRVRRWAASAKYTGAEGMKCLPAPGALRAAERSQEGSGQRGPQVARVGQELGRKCSECIEIASDAVKTTLNIDSPVLAELERLQQGRKEKTRSLGQLVSELLTEALTRRKSEVAESLGFEWISKPMGARVDLEDKESVYAELDRSDSHQSE